VVNRRGEGYGPEYGKQIHYDFGDDVKAAIRSGELRGDIKVRTYVSGPRTLPVWVRGYHSNGRGIAQRRWRCDSDL
jgi:hypothetical protein